MEAVLPYSLKIGIVTVMILAFTGLAVTLFFMIFIMKIRRLLIRKRNSRFEETVKDQLNEVLAEYDEMSEPERLSARKRVVGLIRTKWEKRLLADLLIHYKANLYGSTEQFAVGLYYDLDLQVQNIRDLSARSIRKKIRGIRYLSEMRCETAIQKIHQFINHEQKLLRVEASLALVSLNKNPLEFLDNLKRRMTDWQKINVYKKLRMLPLAQIPAFERWYDSKNTSVVLFALEMTARFNQVHSKDKVAQLIHIDDERVQSQVIRTLVQLEAFEYADVMARLLKIAQSERLIIDLLRAVGALSMEEGHLEIISRFLIHKIHAIRFEAALAIVKIEKGPELLESYVARYPQQLAIISKHMKNDLLN